MTAVVLATAAALVLGTSDYCGARGTRRATPLGVTVVAQLVSLPVLGLLVIVAGGTPRMVDLAWGAGAGVAALFGIVLLYRGLATGAMIVVSPVTAVTAAVLPLGAGLLLDGPLGPLALTGAGLAVLAIALVSAVPAGPHRPVTGGLVGLAVTAGGLFGITLVLLGQVDPGSGLWALLGMRLGSVPVGLLLAVGTGTPLRLPRAGVGWAALAGSLDLLGGGLYLIAAGQGHLGLVAVLASLYPASTVLLALGIDGERARPTQVAGFGLAAAAIVLVTM